MWVTWWQWLPASHHVVQSEQLCIPLQLYVVMFAAGLLCSGWLHGCHCNFLLQHKVQPVPLRDVRSGPVFR